MSDSHRNPFNLHLVKDEKGILVYLYKIVKNHFHKLQFSLLNSLHVKNESPAFKFFFKGWHNIMFENMCVREMIDY